MARALRVGAVGAVLAAAALAGALAVARCGEPARRAEVASGRGGAVGSARGRGARPAPPGAGAASATLAPGDYESIAEVSGYVVTTDGAPCAAARVHVQVMRHEERVQQLDVRSDADGAFTAAGLQPGEIWLSAAGHGCAREEPVVVTVALGAALDDVRIVTEPAFALAGVVVEADGRPVAGVTVAIDQGDERRPLGTIAVSDAAGRFVVEGVIPGEHDLAAHAGGSWADLWVTVAHRDVADVRLALRARRVLAGRIDPPGPGTVCLAEPSTQLEPPTPGDPPFVPEPGHCYAVTPTDARGAFELHDIAREVFVLGEAPDGREGSLFVHGLGDRRDLVVPLLADGDAALAGRVVDDRGAPVGDARVSLQPAGHHREATTAPDGTFHLANLPRGAATAAIRDQEFAITLAGGEHAETFTVPALDAGLHGVVLGVDGAPAADVQVFAVRVDEDGAFPSRHALTGADGAFAFAALWRAPTRLVADSSATDAHAEAVAAPGADAVTLRLAPRAHYRVRVTEHGAPAARYEITCTADSHAWTGTVASPDGIGVPPPGASSPARCAARTATGAARGSIAAGQDTLDLALQPLAHVTGRLVEAQTGEPCVGATVVLTDSAGGDCIAIADETGRFEVACDLVSGTATVYYDDAQRQWPAAGRGGERVDLGTLSFSMPPGVSSTPPEADSP